MHKKQHFCVIEDDEIMRESLCDRFELEGFECDCFTTAASAMEKIGRKRYGVIISDIRLPDLSGEEMFQQLRSQETLLPPWLFITAYGSIERAVSLLKLGVADYITKPFDLDELIEKLRILSTHQGQNGIPGFEPTLGISPAMRKIEEMLPRLARQANRILITGNSGVGKEIVAHEIHRLDPVRSDHPFVAVNCGALPDTLLEAELFGYEKGAFTGALRTKMGLFEQASGGTLFLDEIGDMPAAMQVKLLRIIQEQRVTRIGGKGSIPVNIKLICATHRDLKAMVEQGSFREDLFYRIHLIHIRIPPLNERREDILWLARRFLEECTSQFPQERKVITLEVERLLLAYPWRGNARELKHAIERACILSEGPELDPYALFDQSVQTAHVSCDESNDLAGFLQACERSYLIQALIRHGWHISRTAGALGISRKNLWEKMKKLDISANTVGDKVDLPGFTEDSTS